MEFGRRAQAGLGVAAAAATAALVYGGNGLHPVWPLMWVAPVPVALYALRSSAWRAGLAAFLGMLAGCLNFWQYFHVLGAPRVAWFASFGLEALVFALAVLLLRAVARRGALWSAWLALPAVWVTFEYVRNLLWPHGSAACLAYSQLNFLPFLQLASLTGPWGMSFVLLLFAAGVALGIFFWSAERGRAVRMLGATVGVVAAVLVYGAVRLAVRQPGPVVKVGLVASDTERGVADPGSATERLLAQYAARATDLFGRGAQVVVIPENLGVLTETDVAQVDAVFQPVVDRAGTMLVAGVNDSTEYGAGHTAFNEARVYAAGAPVRTYHKHHLLPPFEDRFTPGRSRLVLGGVGAAANDRWGVEICKDLDFTEPARDNGRAGVGLLLAPAWDFNVDAFWHGHIAVMRAVEDGFSLARSARGGYMTVADDRGRVVAERRSDSAAFATLLAEVPAGHEGTLFQMWGDWFGWLAIALLVWVLVRGWTARPGDTESPESEGREVRALSGLGR